MKEFSKKRAEKQEERQKPNSLMKSSERTLLSKMKKRIGLCLIVKNEEQVIARCLNSVRPLVDYVLVHDTGSTDRTKETVVRWLGQTGIRGDVVDSPWQNFAFNRSAALKDLKERGEVDYALMIDADEVLVFRDAQALNMVEKFKESLSCDLYNITTVLGDCVYSRPQLTSTKKDFFYRGVVHEFLDCAQPIVTRGQVEVFKNKPIQDSYRNSTGDKFQKDAETLKAVLKTEKDPFLVSRYEFYLAQSLRDASEPRESLLHYQTRAALGGWDEEVYVSLLNVARLKQHLKYPIDDVVQSFMMASESVRSRVEAFYEVVKLCRNTGRHYQGYIVGKHAVSLPMPKDGLFLEKWIYDYGLADEYGICAYYAGDLKASENVCRKLLSENRIPKDYVERIKTNLQYATKTS